MKRTTLLALIVELCIILFLYTGISKLMDYDVFTQQIAASPVLTELAPYIAGLLPWLEFLIVILLIIPRWRLKGLYGFLTLMIIFTIYIIALFTFSKELPCSCGGIIAQLSWKQHILFNSLFILLGITGITVQKQIIRETKLRLASIAQ